MYFFQCSIHYNFLNKYIPVKSDQMQLNERFNFSMLLSILEIAGIHIVFVNVVKKVLTPPSLSIHPIVLIVQAAQCQVISY